MSSNFLELDLGNGVKFSITAGQIGLTDERATAIFASEKITHATAMVWQVVHDKSRSLLMREPWGNA